MDRLVFDPVSNLEILFFLFSYVLTQILSSDNQDREHVVENIHNYLRTVGEETRKGLIPMDKFVVNKVTNYLSLLDLFSTLNQHLSNAFVIITSSTIGIDEGT